MGESRRSDASARMEPQTQRQAQRHFLDAKHPSTHTHTHACVRRKSASLLFHVWARDHKCNLTRRLWSSKLIGWTTHDSAPSFTTRVKAAYIRGLIPWVSQLLREQTPPDFQKIQHCSEAMHCHIFEVQTRNSFGVVFGTLCSNVGSL